MSVHVTGRVAINNGAAYLQLVPLNPSPRDTKPRPSPEDIIGKVKEGAITIHESRLPVTREVLNSAPGTCPRWRCECLRLNNIMLRGEAVWKKPCLLASSWLWWCFHWFISAFPNQQQYRWMLFNSSWAKAWSKKNFQIVKWCSEFVLPINSSCVLRCWPAT